MIRFVQGVAITATFICLFMHEHQSAAAWAFVVVAAAVADKWMERQK